MDALTIPPDGDVDRGGIVTGVYWTALVIASIFTGLRFYARIKIKALGWDDWTMLLTIVSMFVMTVVGSLLFTQGGLRHLYFLVLSDLTSGSHGYLHVTYMMHIALPTSFITLGIARVSVAILIMRIITRSVWRRRFLYFCIGMSVASNLLWVILWFAKCPVPTELVAPYYAGLCWDPQAMFILTSFCAGWNVLMDFVLAILPISIFWNLQLSMKKRVSLCILMGWGLLATIFGTIKTVKLSQINSVDFSWNDFDLYLWSSGETVLIVVCGCIPTLKPLYDQFLQSKYSESSWYSSYLIRRSPHGSGKMSSDSFDSELGHPQPMVGPGQPMGMGSQQRPFPPPNQFFSDPRTKALPMTPVEKL